MKADLHIHSTASDGLFTPAQLFEMGRGAGLTHMALTDHDTLAGLAFWPNEKAGPRLIPGVELSCMLNEDIHLLGYGVTPAMTGLCAFLEKMRAERLYRFEVMANRLIKQGIPIALNQITPPPHGSVGRAHLARAIFESGHALSIKDAFNRFLVPGCPAYVPRPRLSPLAAISLLREEGAVPVLAHPGLYSFSQTALTSLLAEWKKAGLMGLEAYHSANRSAQCLAALARSLGLLVTGGSDFHGMADSHSPLGSQCVQWTTAERDMEALLYALQM